MNEQKQETRKDADTESRPPTEPNCVLGDVEGSMMKKRGTVEYPELKGKVIEQVRYKNDPDFTVLVMEFNDNTRASFRLRADVSLLWNLRCLATMRLVISRLENSQDAILPPPFKQREWQRNDR